MRLVKNQRYIVLSVLVVFLAAVYLLVPGDAGYWLFYWWMFPIALVIALVVNTAGISGAALFVPFFILLFPLLSGIHLKPIDTVKLGLITESFGLSSSALAFMAFGLVDGKIARSGLLRALPFVIGGAFFVFLIPKAVLFVVIAILLLLSVVLIRYERTLKQKRKLELQSDRINMQIAAGERVTLTSKDEKVYKYCRTKSGDRKRFIGYSVGGLFQGAAGFGVGEMGIIAMMLTYIPMRVAIGTSHFIVAGTAIAASIVHFFLAASFDSGGFAWNIPLMTVPAVILGGQLAPQVAAKLPAKYLERLVSILFVIIAAGLIILAFKG